MSAYSSWFVAKHSPENYWSLDEASGSSSDAGSGGLTLAESNTPTREAGSLLTTLGESTSFASATFESVNNASAETNGLYVGESGSIGCWFDIDLLTTNGVLMASGDAVVTANEWMALQILNAGEFRLKANRPNGDAMTITSTNASIGTGTTYFVVLVNDNSNRIKMYLNGVELTTSEALGATSTNHDWWPDVQSLTDYFAIGAKLSGTTPSVFNSYDGRISDTFNMSKQLTDAEILTAYNAGTSIPGGPSRKATTLGKGLKLR